MFKKGRLIMSRPRCPGKSISEELRKYAYTAKHEMLCSFDEADLINLSKQLTKDYRNVIPLKEWVGK